MDGIELGKYDDSDIGSSQCSTDETVDKTVEIVLLKVLLGSVAGLDFGRVLDTTLVVI